MSGTKWVFLLEQHGIFFWMHHTAATDCHVLTLRVLTMPPAHSFLSVSSRSYLRGATPGLWGLLLRGDTVRVSAASWGTRRENVRSGVKSYMLRKSSFFFLTWHNTIVSQCPSLLIWRILFISYSLKQVVDNLWRITDDFGLIGGGVKWFWLWICLLSMQSAIKCKKKTTLQAIWLPWLHTRGHMWNKQQAEEDSLPAFCSHKQKSM